MMKKSNVSLSIIQQKTKEAITLPLSSEAMKYLPDRENSQDTDIIFSNLVSLGRSNEILHKWAEVAGISKHVTFHLARHNKFCLLLNASNLQSDEAMIGNG